MKKTILSLCLAAVTFAAQANSLTVINTLSNNITLSFWGTNPDGTIFSTPPVTLIPGSNPFPNPTTFPGVVNAQTDGRVMEAYGVCSPYDLALGSPNIGMVQSSQQIGSPNACNNNVPFVMTWSEQPNAPYAAYILIL